MPRPRTTTHGTKAMYRRKCRCDECRAWNAASVAARRARRPPLADNDPRHGTPTGYSNHRCRKACCREAWLEYKRGLDTRATPPE